MEPSVSDRLRDIAVALRAQVEEGAYADCDEPTRNDMASLPSALERLADELDGRRIAA